MLTKLVSHVPLNERFSLNLSLKAFNYVSKACDQTIRQIGTDFDYHHYDDRHHEILS